MGKRRKSNSEYKMINGQRMHDITSVIAKSRAKRGQINSYTLSKADRKAWCYDKLVEGRFREVKTLIPKIMLSDLYLDLDLETKSQLTDIRNKVDNAEKVSDIEIKFLRNLYSKCK